MRLLRQFFAWCIALSIVTSLVSSAVGVERSTVDLSLGPIAVNTQAVNIALALSVEFPTLGAAYKIVDYDHTAVYPGYFDPVGCYVYKDSTVGAPLSGDYFYRTGTVDSSKYCNTVASGTGVGFSGNALNHALTSSIDLLRYALTGGNRVVDTSSTTVIERAYLRNSWNTNNGNFNSKRIASALVGKVTPDLGAPGKDIYIGSCWDRMVIGLSAASENCGTPDLSDDISPIIPDAVATLTFVVPSGSSAPAAAISGPVAVYSITNPLQTSTVMPTAGPIDFYDIVVGTTGTSTTPFGSAQYVIYADSGATTNIIPSVGPVSPTAQITTTFATRRYQSAVPTGSYRTITTANDGVRVCAVAATLGSAFIGLLDNSGARINVPNGQCGSGDYAGFGTRPTLNTIRSASFNSYEPYALQDRYRVFNATNVYQATTSQRVYRLYSSVDQYVIKGTRGITYARVRVCDDSEKQTRTDLCARYPDGNYKPVGEIQKNALGVRVAAFGYLNDDAFTRYGGVLRAPMKYVGPEYKDPNGVQQTNATSEWNINNGVFTTDPLGASPTFTYSGVINYLNKFGTVGAVKGQYKTFDPVGELYYEALRYFKGLGPTADATTSLPASGTSTLADGFPVYTTTSTGHKWQDPLQNACERRNYILVIGDVNTHRDRSIPGYDPTTATDTKDGDTVAIAQQALKGSTTKFFNAADWTDLITGFETNTSKSYTDSAGNSQNTLGNPNPVSGNTNLATKGTGSGGKSSAYLWAGAAYWANTQPIRYDMDSNTPPQSMSNVRVKTFAIDVDEGGNGLIDSNSRTIQPRNSSFYLAGKYGWFNEDASFSGHPYKQSGTTTFSNSKWEDPDTPNTPEGYVIASQAQKMIDGIRKFFSKASNEKSSITVSSLSSQRFNRQAPDGDLYSPRFSSSDWSGTVQKTKLALNTTTGTVEAQTAIAWDAGAILTSASLATSTVADPYIKPSDRKIFTYVKGGATQGGLEFTVANKSLLNTTVTEALNTNPKTASKDFKIDERISWLRGERSNEIKSTGGTFRARTNIMGDVINSGPVYKGKANPNRQGVDYFTFATSVSSRAPTVFVGSNDGMLHALRASDGKELFAYIPNAVSANLNKLTDSAYKHQPFVDAVAAIDEAQIDTSWKTILASGMGGGAQGVFALDVTDPSAFNASNVLFEFTDQDDADMGNVVSAPLFVKLKIPGTPASYKWFLAVSSGYNNYKTDSFVATSGDQALFLLSLDKPAADPWVINSNYFKVKTDATLGTGANGLANPTNVETQEGVTTILYAGDLQGKLWKFDFTDGIDATLADNSNKVSGTRKFLYQALDAASKPQPITTSPIAFRALVNGYLIVFGTGKFLEPLDNSTSDVQGIYGVWDSFETSSANYTIPSSKMFKRSATESASTIVLSTETFAYGLGSTEKRGWYFYLPSARERISVESRGDTGLVALNSSIPDGTCNGDGSGNRYALNPITGIPLGDVKRETGSGLLSSPNIVEIDLEELKDLGGKTQSTGGLRKRIFRRQIITTTTKIADAGNVTTVGTQALDALNVVYPEGIIGWREIRNPVLK